MPDVSFMVGEKVAQTVAEKTVTEGQKGASGASDFNKLLTERLDQHSQMTKQVLEVFGMGPQNQPQVQAVSAEGLEIRPEQITVNQEIRTHGKTMELLTEWNRSGLQMESIGDVLNSGRRFSPQELLGLQAGLHQIVLEVELAGKCVEQGSNSLKTTLQQNIG